MSKIFFDHLIILDDVESEIKNFTDSDDSRHELWQIIDEIVHHRVFDCIFNHLPDEHHHDFLDKFHETPHDDSLMEYINEKTKEKIEEHIEQEVNGLKKELLQLVRETLSNE